LAHSNDLIHPFSDAVALSRQVPEARLVRAHSPFELRLRPDRLTQEIVTFVEQAFEADAATDPPTR
jgi:hypothetical protein